MATGMDDAEVLEYSNLSSSSSSSNEEHGNFLDDEYGIYPYRFEPPARGHDQERLEAVEQDIQRLQNTEWCTCFNCVPMPTVTESVCCHEVDKVKNKTEEEDLSCIIGHSGFEPVCLNKHVLQTAYFGYRQEYGHFEEDEIHKRYRYTAYRQFVRWCFGFLGKKIRVPIPSCVVRRIQEEFPSIDYEGFHQHPDLPALE